MASWTKVGTEEGYALEFYAATVRNVECPLCKAPKGTPCTSSGGRVLKAPHASRQELTPFGINLNTGSVEYP